jgi:hypothetical protein
VTSSASKAASNDATDAPGALEALGEPPVPRDGPPEPEELGEPDERAGTPEPVEPFPVLAGGSPASESDTLP